MNNMRKDVFNFDIVSRLEKIGQFDMPIVKAIHKDEIATKFLMATQFNFALTEKQPQTKICHFYLDDYQFERVWHKPERYIPILGTFNAVIGPDFSVFVNMPRSQQIYNNWRNKVLMAYWQQCGIKIIPNIQWSDERSFDWCFDGIEPGGIVAISSNGCHTNKAKKLFMQGYYKMLERLRPEQILYVGVLHKELQEDKRVLKIDSFMELRRKIWAEEEVRSQPEK